AKLLFVSLESSSAVVREAFRLGGQGYIHKLRAHSDLLPAIDAVLAGEQFISEDLEFSDEIRTRRHRHEVQFYSDESVFLECATRFIGGALKAGKVAVVLVTKSHQESIARALKTEALDIEREMQHGNYVLLDANEALSSVMVAGLPDRIR